MRGDVFLFAMCRELGGPLTNDYRHLRDDIYKKGTTRNDGEFASSRGKI
jgi:hypothetical protein